MMLCNYGCGREAKYPLKNGKWCCTRSYNSCPEVRKERSKIMKKVFNQPEIKAKIPRAHTFTIEYIKEKYKTFAKEEEMRYNPDKPGEKEIQVHCKYHKCKNSKEKGGWFTPSKEQFRARRDALEHNDGNDGSYFYHSEKCKQECCLYNLRSDPIRLSEFEKYRKDVDKETYKTLKKYSDRIKNFNFRGKRHGYELDHKYSIYDGFKNSVDPKIIGHYKNLECIQESKNLKKNRNSSVILEELLKEIKLDEIERRVK